MSNSYNSNISSDINAVNIQTHKYSTDDKYSKHTYTHMHPVAIILLAFQTDLYKRSQQCYVLMTFETQCIGVLTSITDVFWSFSSSEVTEKRSRFVEVTAVYCMASFFEHTSRYYWRPTHIS